MDYFFIIIGILGIIFRKQNVKLVNKMSFFRVPKFISSKVEEKQLKKTISSVVAFQEIFMIIMGSIFIIFGLLLLTGVIH